MKQRLLSETQTEIFLAGGSLHRNQGLLQIANCPQLTGPSVHQCCCNLVCPLTVSPDVSIPPPALPLHPSLGCQQSKSASRHPLSSIAVLISRGPPICPLWCHLLPTGAHMWQMARDAPVLPTDMWLWHVHGWSQRGDAQNAPMRLIAGHMARHHCFNLTASVELMRDQGNIGLHDDHHHWKLLSRHE